MYPCGRSRGRHRGSSAPRPATSRRPSPGRRTSSGACAVEHPQQPRHGDLRPVSLVADHVEVVDDLGMVGEHHGFRIDVEREHRGRAETVRPAETLGQWVHPQRYWRGASPARYSSRARRPSSTEVGRPVEIRELELIEPRDGEVRVRMLPSGVCHSDLHVREGEWDRPTPIVMGHEGAGVVEAVGPGVTIAACRRPRRTRLAHPVRRLPLVPARRDVGVSRLTVVPAHAARRSRRSVASGRTARSRRWRRLGRAGCCRDPGPPDTDPAVAALIGCCVTTGVGAVLKTAAVPAGRSTSR